MREKLIELCEDVILSCKASLCTDCEHNCIDYPECMGVHFADHLIAHGVTIPVRCKDCQNGADDAWPDGKVWCRKMCRYMNKEGFCSEGVKANDA